MPVQQRGPGGAGLAGVGVVTSRLQVDGHQYCYMAISYYAMFIVGYGLSFDGTIILTTHLFRLVWAARGCDLAEAGATHP